jgi:hypothetical protein
MYSGAVILIADDESIVQVKKGLCFGVDLFVNPKQACQIGESAFKGEYPRKNSTMNQDSTYSQNWYGFASIDASSEGSEFGSGRP